MLQTDRLAKPFKRAVRSKGLFFCKRFHFCSRTDDLQASKSVKIRLEADTGVQCSALGRIIAAIASTVPWNWKKCRISFLLVLLSFSLNQHLKMTHYLHCDSVLSLRLWVWWRPQQRRSTSTAGGTSGYESITGYKTSLRKMKICPQKTWIT